MRFTPNHFSTAFLTLSTICITTTSSLAQRQSETKEMLLPVTPALSPDGATLVFSWNHDLWSKSTDPEDTADAVRLTYHPARETNPLFSPDGKTLYFNSPREGSSQIWSMRADGFGASTQVTKHSMSNTIEDISKDGKTIYYRSVREAAGSNPYRIFSQDVAGKTPEKMLFNASAKSAKLSPDGKKILLTREGIDPYRKGYYGTQSSQIWIYDTETASFSQPVKDKHGVLSPIWIKDGSGFYYVNGHGGNFNLWKHDLTTSNSEQLTEYEQDSVMYPVMSANGSTIVFRKLLHYYSYNTDSGSIDQITLKHSLELDDDSKSDYVVKRCNDADFSPSGLEIVFVANGDLYAMDTVLREPKQLTNTTAYESNTFFADAGKTIYYISDDGVNTSIKKITKKDASDYWWDTDSVVETSVVTTDETIQAFAFSPDGKQIGYSTTAGKLYVFDKKKKSSKVMVSSWNSPSFDWSPDSKWLAYTVMDNNFNSDVYLAPVDGSEEPTNITKHPDNEFAPSFSPDGKKISFIGKRRGSEYDLYYVDLTPAGAEKSARDKRLEMARNAMKKDPIYRSTASKLKKALQQLTPKSPTKSTNPASKKDPKPKTPVKPKAEPKTKPNKNKIPEPAPKPTTKPTPKIEPKPTPGNPVEPTPKTEQAKEKPTKKKSENKSPAKKPEITAKPEKDKKKNPYDLEDIQKRIVRLNLKGGSPTVTLWTPDSKSILIQGKAQGTATYAVNIKTKKPTKYIDATGNPIRFDKSGNLYWVSKGTPGVVKGGRPTSYPFSVQAVYDKHAYNRHVFRLIWRTMRDGFYDEKLNGKNWDAILKKYEDVAATSSMTEDFDRVVSLLLGELNGSHTGYRSTQDDSWKPSQAWSEQMRHLGVLHEAKADGWHITKVLPNGPASKVISKLEVGEIITAIDGKPVNDTTVQHTVLWGQSKDQFLLKVKKPDGEERTVMLPPTSFTAARSYNSASQIDSNKKMVEKLSNGKLGYIHISRMMWDEFEQFEQHLYENGAGKDGIVIDVRNNGGGFTTDHLLTALTQPRHAFTVPRNGGRGYPQDRFVYATWNRPIIVLCNQNSFSNAEIFAHAVRTLERGKVIGVETAGGVISTGSRKIMTAGTLRMPFRGWFNIKTGEDMELNGAKPHVTVWNAPGEISAGIDKQIEKAVKVLTNDVKELKEKRQDAPTIYRSSK